MSRDLRQLGTATIPDPSSLTGNPEYLREYNEAYKRLAEGLKRAIEILRTKYDINFGENYRTLGDIRLKLIPDETKKEPFTFTVDESVRFHPKEDSPQIPTPETHISAKQLNGLFSDLHGIRGYTDSRYSGGEESLNHPSSALIRHGIFVQSGMPLEKIVLSYRRGDPHVHPVYETRVIEPGSVLDEKHPVYRINQALTAFDATESGLHIPVGYNRLALMDAIIRHLDSQIVAREGRNVNLTQSLKGLNGPEALLQPDLFPEK